MHKKCCIYSKISAKSYVWDLRKEVGEAISKICKMEGVTIIKAATLPDHVHMYVSIPPKESVAKMVGRIKGKSSLIVERMYCLQLSTDF